MYLKLLILAIFFITSKLIANESLQTNFTNLKKLLNNKTITIEQFNNGIDNLSISSEDYKSLRELFKNNIINQKDYLNILENLIFESLDMVEKKDIDTDEQSFIIMDGTDSSSRDKGEFLTVTNGAGMAADLTLTADADASFTVS